MLHILNRYTNRQKGMNTLRLLGGLFLITAISSCTEKIDLELDEMDSQIVINALITNEVDSNRVLISQTTPYLTDETPPEVSGATIELSDGENNWQFTEAQAGTYFLEEDFRGVPGTTYTLRVETGNEVYQAHSHMEETVQMDSLNVLPHPWLENHYSLLVHFETPEKLEKYYMWRVSKNDTLLTDSLNKVPFVAGDVFNTAYVTAPVYIFQPEDGIPQTGDTITAEMFSIPEEYYDFLVAMQRNQGSAGGPIVGPPSNIPSNFDNGALGFFAMMSSSEQKAIFN